MMLSLLDRLIARHVIHSTLLVLNVLVALAVFFVLIDALKDYGIAQFGLFELLKYVVLRQPQQVYELSPIGALIGTIMGLSTLALNSELTAMRAAGVSVARIVIATLKVGLLFAVVILLVGEYIVPVSENMAQTGRARALETPLQKKSTGIWLRSGTSFVNIGEVLPDFSLLRMNIYVFGQDNRLRSQTAAQRARHDGDAWRLEGVTESLIVGQEAVQTRRVKQEVWHSVLTPDVVSVFAIRPESLSLQQLHYYIGHLQQNNQDTRNFRLAFWQKSFMPLATLIMMLLATPFVFRQLRSGGLSQRVFIGIMLGLVFIIFHKSIGYFGALYAFPPMAAALLPILLFFALAMYLLHRAARGI
ncbi:MAG: LPS export ABC transporter permease LptG [Gammaproteobacteria bacterium]|nr:LPS export ABC transporter permease LptG [Gammaproteobacteria bacterium]MDH3407069.1 LPS export ABC transporter permease LptG [Gammaproteobacteria bacterium]MDH3563276.1 LPS export ABC transporter permease LptG [Gammaproteobacteria bacterium]